MMGVGAGVGGRGEDRRALKGEDGRLGGEDEMSERSASPEAVNINSLLVDVFVDVEQKFSARNSVAWG